MRTTNCYHGLMRTKLRTCLLILALVQTAHGQRPAKPNVVLILTDDLGWQDVKCYDIDEPSPFETPNIDALAKRGVMFWQAYSPAPTCAPSRCAIMSGIHPARAQKTHVVGGHPPRPHHKTAHPMMPPWYSGRMPENTFTLAKALQKEGYTTGHSGKWHMAISHKAFPQPEDQGFDWTRSDRGARSKMKPNRLSDFAKNNERDRYRLDENGFPKHTNNQNALTFLEEHKAEPFFLYYATWLVHTPIHTRSKQLLDKYCRKLGVEPDKQNPEQWKGKGQTNPFYCAMVEELDYYLGKVFTYLNETDDPRWPGHKLVENTYLIFTSDNGGMEGHPGEIITDNYPLDKGKISAMEGGTRVPLIITGPGIAAGVQSDVMVNGLDFYPTILSWVGAKKRDDKILDGCNLAPLLKQNPKDASLVLNQNGSARDTMVWHFPNSVALESTIRIGDYKLVRNYAHAHLKDVPELELYRLYKTDESSETGTGSRPNNQPPLPTPKTSRPTKPATNPNKPSVPVPLSERRNQNQLPTQTRVDIEESHNLATADPQRAKSMNARLTELLTEMKASYPYNNPTYRHAGPNAKKVPTVRTHKQTGQTVTFTYQPNGSTVVRANLIYTRNGNAKYEEWFRTPANLGGNNTATAQLPKGTTHYFLNLIDENNFLVSYPEVPGGNQMRKSGEKFAKHGVATSGQ